MGKALSVLLGKKKKWSVEDRSVDAISKPIKLEPHGFDQTDIDMADENANPQDVEAYLNKEGATCFKVGVAFVGGADDGSLRLGHAEIVIQKSTHPAGVKEATADQPLVAYRPVVQGKKDEKSFLPKSDLILIHICFPPNDTSELWLVYKKSLRALEYYRYVEMLSIYTTERTLKHVALKACPERHSVVVSDCASVARSFISGLFDILGGSPAELKQLLENIHIEDGWVGVSEDRSRHELARSAEPQGSV